MIPMPNLDDELFFNINENAKNMISQVYPQWTDYNKHDPGITFIELFSWFKEIQQYYLNQLSDSMQEKYLTLLGMEKKSKKASSVTIQGKNMINENFLLPSLTRMFADNICFENPNEEIILNNEIKSIILNDGEIKDFSSETNKLIQDNMLHIFPFGKECNIGVKFKILFTNELPFNLNFNIYFSIYNKYPVKRNPITNPDEFIPLAKIKVKCLTVNGWKNVDIVNDQTCCFLQSGNITLNIPKDTSNLKKYNGGYILNFCLVDSNYDIAPAITEIKMNTINVIQKETFAKYYDFTTIDGYEIILPSSRLSLFGEIDVYFKFGDTFLKQNNFILKFCNNNHNRKIVFNKLLKKKFDTIRVVTYDKNFYNKKVIAIGNNFPYQTVDLEKKSFMKDDFEIMCFDKLNGGFHMWQRKNNFDNSNPNSKDFIFDEIHGIIIFGDGEKGLSPNGEIIIISCSETFDENGNIKSNMIDNCDYNNLKIKNITDAHGGCPAETIDQCLKRFLKSTEDLQKVVTFEDFEKCIYNIQGLMIKQCKAISTLPFSSTNGVTLIVQPYSNTKKATLNSAYIENILNYVENKRLIGTSINVISPQYIGIDIYAEILIKSHYTNAYDIIKNTIENLFENNSFLLGGVISYSNIYCIIDSLECVNYVKKLNITAQGSNHTISDNGNINLPTNGIAYLNRAIYTLNNNI